MKKMLAMVSLLLLPVLSGCVSVPIAPTVLALPGDSKTFEQFQRDEYDCRQYASQQVGIPPDAVANQSTASGAVAGTAIGAGIGALLGAVSGNAGTGAAFGAGTGLLFGTAAGASSGQAYGYDAQRRYDIGYQQCMYAKGNQIPGARRERIYRSYSAPPPPPGYPGVPPDYRY